MKDELAVPYGMEQQEFFSPINRVLECINCLFHIF